jgi:hypothetical protein
MSEAGSAARRVEMEWEVPQPWPELRRLAEELLAAFDGRLAREAPDWIGHCKVLVATAEGCAYASITAAGERASWRGTLVLPATAAAFTVYAVVWATPETAVETAVAHAIAAYLPEARSAPAPDSPLDMIGAGQ